MVSQGEAPEHTGPGLKKYLSPLGVWALGFGCSVGWGAFVMPGTTFLPTAGPVGTLLGMALGAVLMLIIGRNYHYLMERFPDVGGTFSYTKHIFGYDHGFLSAWFLSLTYISIVWANLTALALIGRRIFGDALQFGFHYQLAGYDVYFGEILLELVVLFAIEALCIFGKRLAIGAQIVLAVLLLGGIIVCFALVLNGSGTDGFTPAFAPDRLPLAQVLNIAALTPWAFVGFESVSHSTEEFHFPVKKACLPIVFSVAAGFFSYVLLTNTAALNWPAEFSGWTSYIEALPALSGIEGVPVFFAVQSVAGRAGLVFLGCVVAAGIVTGIIGNSVAASRLLRSMAEDRILPKWFGRLGQDGTPKNAYLFIMLISAVIPFLGRTAIGWIVDVATIGATITYGYTSAAAYRRATEEGNTRIRVSGVIGFLTSVSFSLFLLVPNLWSVSALASESYLILAFWSILGFLFFRAVFERDKGERFGKSTVVWIALLFLIFFTSLMWMRQETHAKTEEALNGISAYYNEVLDAQGVTQSEAEKQAEADYLEQEMESVRRALLRNSLVQMGLIIVGLVVMFNIYAVIRGREKQMEVEKSKAEESSKAKSIFLSNMSHDIRTPMNAIIGYTNLAENEENGEKELREYLTKIKTSSHHLLALINDVLEMSRIESGKMDLEPIPMDLKKTLAEVKDMFSTQMEEKDISFTVDATQLRHSRVLCDKNRLNRVLLNLLSNAYKFTPENGSVSVAAWEIEDDTPGFGRYELRVKDSGIGMTEEFAARVFDAFERERTSTVSKIQGTGLGMAITKSIVDLMGGTIEVGTAPGKGTEFVIRLRLAWPETDAHIEPEERTEDTEEKSGSAVDFSTMRVLLTEDMEINREIATMLLKNLGFTVETAENGAVAVEKVKASAPGYYDAVLMDIQMPVMDGYEATQAIRALPDPALSKVPVVAMTANAFSEDVKKAHDVGMNGHIAKPIDVNDMVSTLREVLKGKEN